MAMGGRRARWVCLTPHPGLLPVQGRRRRMAAINRGGGIFIGSSSLEVVAAFVDPGDDAARETAAVQGFGCCGGWPQCVGKAGDPTDNHSADVEDWTFARVGLGNVAVTIGIFGVNPADCFAISVIEADWVLKCWI